MPGAVDVKRPATRGECARVPRPCPFVSCRYHLLLTVSDVGSLSVPPNGANKRATLLQRPAAESEARRFIDEAVDILSGMRETCALDVAEQGEQQLVEIASLLRTTKQRIKQIEIEAMVSYRVNATKRGVVDELRAAVNDNEPIDSVVPELRARRLA